MKFVPHPQGHARRAALCARLGLAALTGSAALAAPAAAQDSFNSPVVIELFTSQGCSSCPAADKLLAGLARKPNVIALSFSVDYWDYIGWKDTLASPAFTARQKAYAAARGDGLVYTPQVIVDGMQHVVGSDLAAIRAAAAQMYGNHGAMKVAMHTRAANGGIVAEIGEASAATPARAGLWLYLLLSAREVQIGRGENRGRTITYVNIVRSMHKVGEWRGKAARFEIAADALKRGDANGWVLILQSGSEAKPGAILAAAKADGF